MSRLIEHALQYAARGWPVFPCATRGKRPLTPKGCHDATTDAATIRRWWASWPEANIGLACGVRAGVSVVDVDVKIDETSGQVTEDGWASLAALEAEQGAAPATVCTSTPGLGGHFIFANGSGGPPANKNDFREGIDIRGDGYYIILPPSIHPNGGAYAWVEGHSPDDREPAELPAWFRPELEKPQQTSPPTPPVVARGAYTHQSDNGEQLRRASAYLETMDAAVMGAGGHDRLYAAATAMVHGFDLTTDAARSLLIEQYNPRCAPPWDMSNPRDAKDFNRKIEQAATRPHDQPRGWLLVQELDGAGDSEHGAQIAAALIKGQAKADPVAVQSPALGDLPRWLLEPPGYVGELTNWINATAFKPQPMLALANALAFFGAVVGRKVATETDLRTNLYCMSIGNSCAGKEHSRSRIKQLAAAAGIADKIIGAEDTTSDAAIVNELADKRSMLMQIDEIGHFIAGANNRNAMTYHRAVPVTLTKLYTSSNSIFIGKSYADVDRRVDIDQPNLCIYGSTVAETLYGGITSAEIRDGFLGRMLVFQSNDPNPPETDAPRTPPTKSLVNMAQAWYQRKIAPPAGVENLEATLRAWQITVQSDARAKARFLELRALVRSTRDRLRSTSPAMEPLWGRVEENARKVALTIAAGCDYTEPVIDEQIANYACELVTFITHALVRGIENNVADTPAGRNINKIKEAIRHHGGTATQSQVTRYARSMTKKDRDEAKAALVEMGEVEVVRVGEVGRPAVAYRLLSR